MKVSVIYQLSSVGQKASILAGGDGKAEQTIDVPKESPEFAGVVEAGRIDADGNVVLQTHGQYWPGNDLTYDTPQTAASVLARVNDVKAEKERKDAEIIAARRASTLATITERKTTKHRDSYTVSEDGVDGSSIVEYDTADWPYDRDDAIVKSPEGKAFVEELHIAEVAARAEAEVRARADLAVKKAAKVEADKLAAEKAAKLAADKIAMGGEETDYRVRIEDGAYANVPIWESHSRGKNWLATIKVDSSKPGGLNRDFAVKAKGDSYYLNPSLNVGDAVEFGADYYSGRGRPSRKRWYGFVVATSPDAVLLRECSTGKAAVREGTEFRNTPVDPSKAPRQIVAEAS